jgi:hypothetical protein
MLTGDAAGEGMCVLLDSRRDVRRLAAALEIGGGADGEDAWVFAGAGGGGIGGGGELAAIVHTYQGAEIIMTGEGIVWQSKERISQDYSPSFLSFLSLLIKEQRRYELGLGPIWCRSPRSSMVELLDERYFIFSAFELNSQDTLCKLRPWLMITPRTIRIDISRQCQNWQQAHCGPLFF